MDEKERSKVVSFSSDEEWFNNWKPEVSDTGTELELLRAEQEFANAKLRLLTEERRFAVAKQALEDAYRKHNVPLGVL
jgi:Lon protease-like protein